MMTIGGLIEMLQDAASDLGDDTPVHVAMQPNYPVALTPVTVSWMNVDVRGSDESTPLVYIATDGSPYDRPYADGRAWDGGLVDDELEGDE